MKDNAQEINHKVSPLDTTESGNKSIDDLREKISKLGEIERQIFKESDGFIGSKKNKTQIDIKYEKEIENAEFGKSENEYELNAKQIQKKIKIVENLIAFFSPEKYFFEEQKKLSNIDENGKKLIDETQKNISKLSKKYPNYQKSINFFAKYSFDVTQNYECSNNKDINKFLQDNLQYTKILEGYIKLIDKNNDIKYKEYFFQVFLEKHIGKLLSLGDNFGNITNLNLFKNGFEFGEISIINLIEITLEKLKKLDELYKKGDKEELFKYFKENFSDVDKNAILEIKDFKKLYLENETEKLGLNEKNKNYFIEDLIVNLSLIKNQKLKNDLVEFSKKLSSQNSNENYILLDKFFEKNINSINDFGDKYLFTKIINNLNIKNNEFWKQNNIGNDISFENLFEKINNQNAIFVTDLNKIIVTLAPQEQVLYKQKIDEYKNVKSTQKPDLYVLYSELNSHGKNSVLQEQKHENKEEKPKENISHEKKRNLIQRTQKLGLEGVEISDEGKIIGKNGETQITQKLENGKVELNTNNEFIFTSSLGYKMKYENNEVGIESSLETLEKFNYLNKIGLGYFGENFKKMLNGIKDFLPNQGGGFHINEQKGDFLDYVELDRVLKIFINIGFIDKNQNLDYLLPDKIQDITMQNRLQNIENGSSFLNGKFDINIFKEILQKTNKV